MQKIAIIVAGGSGKRMGTETPKQFLHIAGKPILLHTFMQFAAVSDVEIVVVLPQEHISLWQTIINQFKVDIKHQVIAGGAERFYSVKNAIGSLMIENEALIAIHDGVRPFASKALIERCFKIAATYGNCVPAIALKDSLRKIDGEKSMIVNRDKYKLVQTPQVFKFTHLNAAYNQAFNTAFTDDASVLEAQKETIHLTEGEDINIKITSPSDLVFAEAILHAF
jgi:2-C-methyl-D-erythritol 4-phosphate cytidylyltransferase